MTDREGEHMAEVVVRDAGPEDAYFVSTCSHTGESEEVDACGRRRAEWLDGMRARGLRTQVALIDGAHAEGQFPLDVPATGADFYAACGHKWLKRALSAR